MIRFGHTRAQVRGGTIPFVLLFLLALLPTDKAIAQAVPPGCPSELGTEDLIDHNFGVSFCELCGVGQVRIEIENPLSNPNAVDFADVVIREDLLASGLTYVPNSTAFTGNNIVVPSAEEPLIGGPNASLLTWDLSDNAFVMNRQSGGPGSRAQLFLTFQVERAPGFTEESLLAADRRINAEVDLSPSCAPLATFTKETGIGTLPLEEPEPTVLKRGRNLDAGQSGYSDPVFGHEGDDIVWRIQVRNDGDAPLQDFVFDDAITGTNFDINYICDNETDAVNAASGGAIGGCNLIGPTQSIAGVDVAARFGPGTPANPYIAAPANGSGFYFFTGRITESCSDETNTVNNVEWGCQVETPVGGLSATSGGSTTQNSAILRTQSVEADLDIDVALSGVVLSQDMGGTGTVTITIANNSGGTVLGETGGLRIRNLLPPQYVVDPTFTPTVSMAPRFAPYDGMINTIAWTNPNPNTVPILLMGVPADPLSNTELDLLLTSDTAQSKSGFPDREHMIRDGDVVTVTIRTVLIDTAVNYYDYVADLDVRTEAPGSTPANTDPTESFSISNETEVRWQELCTATLHDRTVTEVDTARPEDIDPDIVGSELIFILTDTGDSLPLTVNLTNNGGHRAADYTAYVTFGEAMTVQTVAPGCTLMVGPRPRPVWQEPVDLPGTASVYLCDRGDINPGETESLNFEVVKNTAASFDDDLTFSSRRHRRDPSQRWHPAMVPHAPSPRRWRSQYGKRLHRRRRLGPGDRIQPLQDSARPLHRKHRPAPLP